MILSIAFRPFFLAAGLWAVLAIGLWWALLQGGVTLPAMIDPVAWHRHEMLFGYFGAVVAGFVLTAIPNWTGRAPIAGWRLALLAVLWLAARLAMLFAADMVAGLAMALEAGFFLLLAAFAAKEILAARNRNVPIPFAIAALGIACAIDHADMMGWQVGEGLGWRLALAILLVLVSLIGGRIIPTFTRNWLTKRTIRAPLPVQADRFDLAIFGVTALALLAWAILPSDRKVGAALILAGIFNSVRLARWRGWQGWRDPLLFILHLAYAWLPLGLALLGLSILGATISRSAALHALGVGALALMTMAVMTRATLGHTGRELRASGLTVAAYGLLFAGAVARTAASLWPQVYDLALSVAAAGWIASFALFIAAYAPQLLRPRVDA
jgi:uncharacterized protein involved in response to NO